MAASTGKQVHCFSVTSSRQQEFYVCSLLLPVHSIQIYSCFALSLRHSGFFPLSLVLGPTQSMYGNPIVWSYFSVYHHLKLRIPSIDVSSFPLAFPFPVSSPFLFLVHDTSVPFLLLLTLTRQLGVGTSLLSFCKLFCLFLQRASR